VAEKRVAEAAAAEAEAATAYAVAAERAAAEGAAAERAAAAVAAEKKAAAKIKAMRGEMQTERGHTTRQRTVSGWEEKILKDGVLPRGSHLRVYQTTSLGLSGARLPIHLKKQSHEQGVDHQKRQKSRGGGGVGARRGQNVLMAPNTGPPRNGWGGRGGYGRNTWLMGGAQRLAACTHETVEVPGPRGTS